MRLFWVSFGVLLLGVGFSGCWNEESSISTELTSEEITLTGTLQSLSNAGIDDKVTHLLRTPEDAIYYVYSEEVDLFDLEWSGVLVEISGELFPPKEEGNKPVIRIDTLALSDAESESETSATMIPYQNDVFGFSMNYQSDWTLEDSASLITVSSPFSGDESEFDTITISKRANAQSLSVEEWFLEYGVLETSMPYVLGAIGPESIPVVKVSEGTTLTYYVQDLEQILVVAFESLLEEQAVEHENLFNEMLYSFDLWSDGLRDSEGGTGTDGVVSSVELSESQSAVMELLMSDFNEGSIEKLSFVHPNYVYVEYVKDEAEEKGRQLLAYSESYDFTTIATFESGAFTDWELVSGEDVAKGKESLVVNPGTGIVVLIPEGYRGFESAALAFQMAYPSSWYYARSGDFYYFSDEPAEASNALITLELVEGAAEYEVMNSGDRLLFLLPRDESSHFELSGSLDYEVVLLAMAGSFQVLP